MSQRATLLVVDDIAANRETFCELLDAAEYRIIEATDGPTALQLAAETPPDLVLLDVMMPGMDGFEVCRRLRADTTLAEVPIILVTALDDQASRVRGIEAGADDFISKPFNRLELRTRVRTITRLNRYRRLHEAQAAVRDSEKHFRALVSLGPIAIYSCSVDGVIQDFNERAVALWGRVPKQAALEDQFCGSFKLYHPDGTFLSHEQSPMAEVCRGQIPTVEARELQIERPDGSRVTVLFSVVPLRDDRGDISCAIGCFQDITERKTAELERRESEQELKAIFDQAAVGVVQADLTTRRFQRYNQWFCDFLGRTHEEMGRLSYTEITHPQDLGLDLENIRNLNSGAFREFTQEKRYLRKDGSIVWASVAVSAIGPAGEKPTDFITIVLDITERKRLNEHFVQAQKMEALGQFSGGVAHDFNNILAAISGYTELSRMILKGNAEVHDHLGAVLKAIGRAADLVRQILTFSRRDTQVRRIVKLDTVVAETLNLMRALIPTTIEFDTAIAPDVPSVLANANQIHQVLMNLGINAWHAIGDRPGRLKMEVERFAVSVEYAATKPRLQPGDYVRLSVSDTGCGMDPATLRRIFEPFFSTKAPGAGTGLGLSVVHGIMDSHDGAITVHSEPGEGTVFRLYFPVHCGEAATPNPTMEGVAPRGSGERILVVDDEEILALMLQKTLLALGYEVECMTDSTAALALVRSDPGRFTLVVSDQTMPGMTGLALASELQLIRPGLPVILMTGYSLSLTAERIEEAGVRQLILKPVTIRSLGRAVHAAISGKPPTHNESNSPYR